MSQLTTKDIRIEYKTSTRTEKLTFTKDLGIDNASALTYITQIENLIGERVFRTTRQINETLIKSLEKRADYVLLAYSEFTNDLSAQNLDLTKAILGGELLARQLARLLHLPRERILKELGIMRGKIKTRLGDDVQKVKIIANNLGGSKTDRTSFIDPLDRVSEYMFYDAFALIRGPRNVEIADFNNDITNVNVSLSTDITPGSFSITFANPLEQYVDDFGFYSFYAGDTIKIFATRRFPQASEDRYTQIFWGIIEQVVDDYSDGAARVTLAGQDITAWLQYTTIRPAPTISDIILSPGLDVSHYGHKYANQTILDIMADVLFNDIGDFNALEAYHLNGKKVNDKLSEAISKEKSIQAAIRAREGKGESGATDAEKSSLAEAQKTIERLSNKDPDKEKQSIIAFWKEMFLDELSLKVLGFSKRATLLNKDNAKDFGRKNEDKKSRGDGPTAASGDAKIASTKAQEANGVTHEIRSLPIDQDTRCSALKILDHYIPIRMFADVPISETFQIEDAPKIEVIRRVLEGTMFEFFMDCDGYLVLKPPFYNEYPVNNDTARYKDLVDEAACEGSKSFQKIDSESRTGEAYEYTIKELDIISFTIKEDSSGIVTRQEVTAEPEKFDSNQALHYGAYQNNDLIKRFGIRAGSPKKQRMLNSSTDAIVFAKSLMDYQNLKFYSGTVTIIGRPELHLGRTIYFEPRNVIFYITGISHTFTPGGTFTTTLTLIAGRRMMLDESGQPRKNVFDGEQFIDKSIGSKIKDTDQAISGIEKSLSTVKKGSADEASLQSQLSLAKNQKQKQESQQKRQETFDKIREQGFFTENQKQNLGAIPRRISDSFGRRLYGTLPYGLLVTPPKVDEKNKTSPQTSSNSTVAPAATAAAAGVGSGNAASSAAAGADNSPGPDKYIEKTTPSENAAAAAAAGARSINKAFAQKLVSERTKACTDNSENKAFNPSSIIKRRIVNGGNL